MIFYVIYIELEYRTLPLLFLLQRRILFFFLDNDLFPPPLCMFLGASPSAPLLARQVWLLGSSFCRFASLVFILRLGTVLFLSCNTPPPFFLFFIIVIIIIFFFFFFFVFLHPSLKTTCAHVIIIRNLSPRNPERDGARTHSLIEKFKELNSASLILRYVLINVFN